MRAAAVHSGYAAFVSGLCCYVRTWSHKTATAVEQLSEKLRAEKAQKEAQLRQLAMNDDAGRSHRASILKLERQMETLSMEWFRTSALAAAFTEVSARVRYLPP